MHIIIAHSNNSFTRKNIALYLSLYGLHVHCIYVDQAVHVEISVGSAEHEILNFGVETTCTCMCIPLAYLVLAHDVHMYMYMMYMHIYCTCVHVQNTCILLGCQIFQGGEIVVGRGIYMLTRA